MPADAGERFAQGHSRRGRPVPYWDCPRGPARALRSTVADLLRFLRLQFGEGDPAPVRAAALTHAPRWQRRGGFAVGLGWMRLTPGGSDHEVLFHNGGTGGFRSFTGFVPGTGAAAVVLSNSARSVDPPGFRILERIGATLQSWAASV